MQIHVRAKHQDQGIIVASVGTTAEVIAQPHLYIFYNFLSWFLQCLWFGFIMHSKLEVWPKLILHHWCLCCADPTIRLLQWWISECCNKRQRAVPDLEGMDWAWWSSTPSSSNANVVWLWYYEELRVQILSFGFYWLFLNGGMQIVCLWLCWLCVSSCLLRSKSWKRTPWCEFQGMRLAHWLAFLIAKVARLTRQLPAHLRLNIGQMTTLKQAATVTSWRMLNLLRMKGCKFGTFLYPVDADNTMQ